jgi:hypothetical protein
MKTVFILSFLLLFVTSCSSLNSVTSIKPNDSFVLGNNEHGPFSVRMRNLSTGPVTVFQREQNGKTTASQTIAINESVSVKVPAKAALVVSNPANNTASVKLKVKGDKGLSMQYKQVLR